MRLSQADFGTLTCVTSVFLWTKSIQESMARLLMFISASVLARAAPKEAAQKSIHLDWLSAITGVWAASEAFLISSTPVRVFLSTKSNTSWARFCASGKTPLATVLKLVKDLWKSCMDAAWVRKLVQHRPA